MRLAGFVLLSAVLAGGFATASGPAYAPAPEQLDKVEEMRSEAATDPVAALALGLAYRGGAITGQDHRAAVRWLRVAANGGSAEAHLRLAEHFAAGIGVRKDMGAYARHLRQAALLGDWLAQREIAVRSFTGTEDSEPERLTSLAWFAIARAKTEGESREELLDQQIKKVASSIGRIDGTELQDRIDTLLAEANALRALYGLEPADDTAEAATVEGEDLISRAEDGDVEAMYQLGMEIERVIAGTSVSLKVDWLKRAAEAGHSGAQAALSDSYRRGFEMDLALDWARRSADQDDPEGKMQLAFFYLKGAGVWRNTDFARELYQEALSDGAISAAGRLAALEREAGDDETAIVYARLGARFGDPISQSVLGGFYADGDGVEADLAQAYRWMTLAIFGSELDTELQSRVSQRLAALEERVSEADVERAVRLLAGD